MSDELINTVFNKLSIINIQQLWIGLSEYNFDSLDVDCDPNTELANCYSRESISPRRITELLDKRTAWRYTLKPFFTDASLISCCSF